MKVGTSVVGVDAPDVTVLTYDDGPTRGVTDHLLTALAERGATATFFMLLTRVRRDPALLHEVLAAGHDVGLHGLDHQRLTTVRAAKLPAWMRDGRRELEDAAGVEVRWFRPPYGAQSRASWRAAVHAGLTPVHWGVACHDWVELPLEEHLREIREQPLAGRVVLLHDGFGEPSDGAHDGPPPAIDRVGLANALLGELDDRGLSGRSLADAVRSASPRTQVRLSIEASKRVRVRRTLGRLRRS